MHQSYLRTKLQSTALLKHFRRFLSCVLYDDDYNFAMGINSAHGSDYLHCRNNKGILGIWKHLLSLYCPDLKS